MTLLLLSELTRVWYIEPWRLLSFIKDVARRVSSYIPSDELVLRSSSQLSFFFFLRLFDDHIDRPSNKKENRRKGFC